MNSSLDALVKNLSDNDSKYSSQEFSGDLLKLVKQKGVYPFEYMDSFKKFFEDKLPDRCEFFISLKNECISEKDYSNAINVWNTFKMNTMGGYHDLYLKSDVLLLADVFEKFINICLEYYGLDPCHYFSCPGLNLDAMLKITGIELELISDIEMHLFIEKGMRGGISYIAKSYSKANNKYMQSYDANKPSEFITYLDANNLYGWAMSQYLPYSGLKWLSQKEMSSKYCSNIANKYGIKIEGVNKLVPNLGNKRKYVFQYKSLQLYLSLRIKIVGVHRVLKFKQSDWLKKYIDFNTDKRKNAVNSFEKGFF